MAEERYDRSHHLGATPEERVRNRLKTSAEPQRGPGSHQVTVGNSPNRTVTTVHPSGNTRQHGEDRSGIDIHGNTRGPANPKGQIE
jgi:hypothetical protein